MKDGKTEAMWCKFDNVYYRELNSKYCRRCGRKLIKKKFEVC